MSAEPIMPVMKAQQVQVQQLAGCCLRVLQQHWQAQPLRPPPPLLRPAMEAGMI